VPLKTTLAQPVVTPSKPVRGRLPDANDDWVTFDEADRLLLQGYLTDAGIEELREACSLAGGLYHWRRLNPISVASTKQHLSKVADAAAALSAAFALSSRYALTLTALLESECGADRGRPNTKELVRLLSALEHGCRQGAKRYVGQSQRRTPEYEVRLIASVIEPLGIRPSAAPGSRFMRIARVCFRAMGIMVDPGRAVRTYVAHKDDKGLRY